MEVWKCLLLLVLVALCSNLSNCVLIDSVAESDVYDAAQEALRGADDNAVAPCFANVAGFGDLTNVQSYSYYGVFEDILPFNVEVGQTSVVLHNNDQNLIGTAGMMSYDITGTDYKVVVAYYSPFNDLLYDNQFNMKIYETSAGTNEDLFKHMLSDSALWFPAENGQYQLRSEYGIEMRAVMENQNKASLAVFVDSSGHNVFLGPELNYGCDYDGLFDKRCWRECDANNPGWQWTTQGCWTEEDCDNPNEMIPDSDCFIDGPW